ncbi:MAG: hypothetical protein LBH01_09325 [Verrucomicrobiales bacterium]|jgi:hypothetical protein|nr:hypothetical protein [Verrucomicrobiales bacterium]
MSDYNITLEDIKKYTIQIDVTADWVASRDPDYPVNSVSLKENRFNQNGETAYYIASGSPTMKAEVPNWQDRITYPCSPSTIHAFNLVQWSEDKGCREDFLQSKADGGYGLCQQVANQLTGAYGLSGILYNSYQRHSVGETGTCLVILPPSGILVEETFFIKDH